MAKLATDRAIPVAHTATMLATRMMRLFLAMDVSGTVERISGSAFDGEAKNAAVLASSIHRLADAMIIQNRSEAVMLVSQKARVKRRTQLLVRMADINQLLNPYRLIFSWGPLYIDLIAAPGSISISSLNQGTWPVGKPR